MTEMPLDNIRENLELLKDGNNTAKLRRDIIKKQKIVLQKRINELTGVRSELHFVFQSNLFGN